jgi:hypothetical protein
MDDDGFDHWLEHGLKAGVPSGPSPAPAQARYHAASIQGGTHMSVFARVVSVVTTRAAIGFAVAVLALAGAAVVAEAAITGSANPSNWGQQVTEQVAKCKAALTQGTNGIGECVSTFAKQHGEQVSADHRASAARENDKNNGNANGNKNDGKDKGKDTQQGDNGQGKGDSGNHGNPRPGGLPPVPPIWHP